jgi:hypothetical protein
MGIVFLNQSGVAASLCRRTPKIKGGCEVC